MENVPPCKYALSLLGRFELTGPDGVVEFASKKAAALLAFLACTAPQLQRREKLTDLLWGSHLEAQARQNLRQALYVLRRILGDDSIVSHGHCVSLKAGVVACDVPRFEALIRDGSRDALAAATELHKGPLLVDLDIAENTWKAWLASERHRLQGLALDAMVRLGELELASGKAEAAVRAADRAIADNDVREDAHRLRMRALALSGRRPDALRHYEHLIALLKRELDVEPDAATKALARELRKPAPASVEFQPTPSPVSRAAAHGEATALPLPDRPSIAVLPFDNMSGDPDQEYLPTAFPRT
jgi:DNA-binding SARP family transcriptional activator